ncbi:MAG: amino acid-binding protein [Methanolinea sp.]|nr:amino acid-binding protein [Methanolinea sp.]
MKLEMKDAPGQLVAALRPISEVGGNIIAVIHQRDRKGERGEMLSVQIVLELPDQRLSDLIRLIREQGVNIQRIGHERLLYEKTVIVIGHLIHTDLGDTVDRIDCTGFAEVTGLNISMPAITQVSSARLVIKAVNKEDMEQAMEILRRVSREKDFLLVEPLEEVE